MKPLFALVVLLTLAAPLAAADAVLYCFTADWCTYCHQMKPVLGRLQKDGYPIQIVDRDQQPQLAQQMGVRGLPNFVLVSGNQIVEQVEGATSYDRLAQLFQAAKPAVMPADVPGPQQVDATRPVTAVARGQSPGVPAQYAAASVSAGTSAQPDIQATAMQATVKLKVSDPDGSSYGTGTVVHAQGNEALVLTCAHIFRDSKGQGPLEVLTFQDSPSGTSVPGQVLSYDLDRDVALVAIRTQTPITPMPLASPQISLEVGQGVFSIGCDHGGERQLHQTRINSLNRYAGPENIQAAGAPAVGRSGGGLFTADGQLIGVCNAADDQDDEGIYAALSSIYAVVNEAQLTHLFSGQAAHVAVAPVSPAAAPPARQDDWGTTAAPTPQAMAAAPAASSRAIPPASGGSFDDLEGLSEAERELLHYLRGQRGGAEVTVVLRSKDNPQAQPAVFTLPQSAADAQLRQAQTTGRAPLANPALSHPNQVLRGQNR